MFFPVPVSSVYEGHIVDLKNDPLADPNGDKVELAYPLAVQNVYGGSPRVDDVARVHSMIEVNPKTQSTNDGFTLLLSCGPAWKLIMIHFPDDQYEVLARVEGALE